MKKHFKFIKYYTYDEGYWKFYIFNGVIGIKSKEFKNHKFCRVKWATTCKRHNIKYCIFFKDIDHEDNHIVNETVYKIMEDYINKPGAYLDSDSSKEEIKQLLHEKKFKTKLNEIIYES